MDVVRVRGEDVVVQIGVGHPTAMRWARRLSGGVWTEPVRLAPVDREEIGHRARADGIASVRGCLLNVPLHRAVTRLRVLAHRPPGAGDEHERFFHQVVVAVGRVTVPNRLVRFSKPPGVA